MIDVMNRRDSFGRRLFLLRTDLGLTQGDIIEDLRRMGITIGQTYVSTLENSDSRMPNGEVVAGLARILGTTTDYLLLLSDDSLPPNAHDGDIGISSEAEELARIVDRLPPYRRNEILGHAKMVEVMEAENERDIAAAIDAVAAELRTTGLVIGPETAQTIRRALRDYAASLLGADAVAAVDAMTGSALLPAGSRRKAKA